MQNLNKAAYKVIATLIEGLEVYGHRKIENSNGTFMAVVVEVIGMDKGCKRVSIAHYYEQNGDLMADPEMEFLVREEAEFAQAVTFRQDSLGLHQEARWTAEDGRELCRPRLLSDINSFAATWMRNIKQQQGL